MIPLSFHSDAPLAYVPPATGRRELLLYPRRPLAPVREFIRRYGDELQTYAAPPCATRELLTALALASSFGNPEFYRYQPNIAAALLGRVEEPLLAGEPRATLCYVGLFGIALPLLRAWSNQPDLSVSVAVGSVFQFRLIAAKLVAMGEHLRTADPVRLALSLHGSNFGDAHSKPFRVQYRGEFLPDFCGYYNTAVEHLYKEQKHGGQTSKSERPRGDHLAATADRRPDQDRESADHPDPQGRE